jgi:hypothetical protein
VRGYRWVDADDAAAIVAMQKKVPQSVAECFDLIEREMFAGPWVMGPATRSAIPTSLPWPGGWKQTASSRPIFLKYMTI